MKTIFLGFALLCGTAAFGQVGVSAISNEPVPLQLITHQRHADQHEMASEQSLLPNAAYVTATGERPLWECGTIPQERPLGDIARDYRKEHEFVKKAQLIFEKQ
jgi:hypothetical protein